MPRRKPVILSVVQQMVGDLRILGAKMLYLSEDKASCCRALIDGPEKCSNLLGEMEISALKIGNILTGAYVYAFSTLPESTCYHQPPP